MNKRIIFAKNNSISANDMDMLLKQERTKTKELWKYKIWKE
jgi:hypothetical protein